MLCLRYPVPVLTRKFEAIKISKNSRSVVVCATKGPRPRYPRVWKKTKRRIGTISKAAKMVEAIKQLSNVKEEVYGALDAYIAWELEFPLITVKKALKSLEFEKDWKRIIQVTKWMLSKGQGKTMGTYYTLLNALAEDGRLEEAEELWSKLFTENLEGTPRIFFNKMISVYFHRRMYDRMFEVFADMEELDVRPNVSIVNMMGRAFQDLNMQDKLEKLMKKYPQPKWEFRYYKGKRVRVRIKPKYDLADTEESSSQDQETNQIQNESFNGAEANIIDDSFNEPEASVYDLFDEVESDQNDSSDEVEAAEEYELSNDAENEAETDTEKAQM